MDLMIFGPCSNRFLCLAEIFYIIVNTTFLINSNQTYQYLYFSKSFHFMLTTYNRQVQVEPFQVHFNYNRGFLNKFRERRLTERLNFRSDSEEKTMWKISRISHILEERNLHDLSAKRTCQELLGYVCACIIAIQMMYDLFSGITSHGSDFRKRVFS